MLTGCSLRLGILTLARLARIIGKTGFALRKAGTAPKIKGPAILLAQAMDERLAAGCTAMFAQLSLWFGVLPIPWHTAGIGKGGRTVRITATAPKIGLVRRICG